MLLFLVVLPQASLNVDDPQLAALLEGLPESPAAARRQFLETCGLDVPSDDGSDDSEDP